MWKIVWKTSGLGTVLSMSVGTEGLAIYRQHFEGYFSKELNML